MKEDNDGAAKSPKKGELIRKRLSKEIGLQCDELPSKSDDSEININALPEEQANAAPHKNRDIQTELHY